MAALTALLVIVLSFEGYSANPGFGLSFGSNFGGWKPSTSSRGYTRGSGRANNDIWTSAGVVPEKLERIPEQLLSVQFGPFNVKPNDTMLMSQMQSRPRLYWEADPSSLYMLIMEDEDVSLATSGGQKVHSKHWVVTNIPGSDVAAGDEPNEYLYGVGFNSDQGVLDVGNTRDKRFVLMVYKQNRRIEAGEVPVVQGGKDILKRFGPSHIEEDINSKYDLEEGPVAANFFRVGYQPGWSELLVCSIKQDLGENIVKIPRGWAERYPCLKNGFEEV